MLTLKGTAEADMMTCWLAMNPMDQHHLMQYLSCSSAPEGVAEQDMVLATPLGAAGQGMMVVSCIFPFSVYFHVFDCSFLNNCSETLRTIEVEITNCNSLNHFFLPAAPHPFYKSR